MFGNRDWQPAEARIILVNIKRVSGDGLTPTREWAADVTRADGTVFRARIDEPRWVTDFWPPDAGAVVKVQVDAKTQAVRFDVKGDPGLTVTGQDRVRAEDFKRSLDE